MTLKEQYLKEIGEDPVARYCFHNGNSYPNGYSDTYVKWLETELQKPDVSKWISVDEQMPEENKSLLANRKGGRVCNLYFDGQDWRDDGYDSADTKTFLDVTHWMPLPEPPTT